MTRNELIKEIAVSKKLTLTTATLAVDGFIDAVVGALEKGEDVSIRDFAKFTVCDVAERQGFNPHTGEKCVVPAHKAVRIKASKALSERIK